MDLHRESVDLSPLDYLHCPVIRLSVRSGRAKLRGPSVTFIHPSAMNRPFSSLAGSCSFSYSLFFFEYSDPAQPGFFTLNHQMLEQDLVLLLAAMSDLTSSASPYAVETRLHLMATVRRALVFKKRSLFSEKITVLVADPVQEGSGLARRR